MSKQERNAATTVVYLFLRRGDEILIGRRCNTGYQDGNYQVPAGHVDAGELPTEALVREAKEEIGITLKPGDLKLIHVSFREKHDETGDRVDFFFEARAWGGEIMNTEPHKCDELRWEKINSLPSNMTPHIRIAIESAEKGEPFSELDVEFLRSTGLYVLSDPAT